MNCEELITYLSDYIDLDLNEELRVEAQKHLTTCHNCHVVLDTTQKMILLYRETGHTEIPAGRREKLFERLQQAFDQVDGESNLQPGDTDEFRGI